MRDIDARMPYNIKKEYKEWQANISILKKLAVKTNLPRRILDDSLSGTRQKGMDKRRNVTFSTQVVELPLFRTRFNFRNFNHCNTKGFRDIVRGKMRKGNEK